MRLQRLLVFSTMVFPSSNVSGGNITAACVSMKMSALWLEGRPWSTSCRRRHGTPWSKQSADIELEFLSRSGDRGHCLSGSCVLFCRANQEGSSLQRWEAWNKIRLMEQNRFHRLYVVQAIHIIYIFVLKLRSFPKEGMTLGFHDLLHFWRKNTVTMFCHVKSLSTDQLLITTQIKAKSIHVFSEIVLGINQCIFGITHSFPRAAKHLNAPFRIEGANLQQIFFPSLLYSFVPFFLGNMCLPLCHNPLAYCTSSCLKALHIVVVKRVRTN